MLKFEVFKGRGKHPWYWRARASNGQITAQSEGYVSKRNAKRAAIDFIHAVDIEYSYACRAETLIVEVD